MKVRLFILELLGLVVGLGIYLIIPDQGIKSGIEGVLLILLMLFVFSKRHEAKTLIAFFASIALAIIASGYFNINQEMMIIISTVIIVIFAITIILQHDYHEKAQKQANNQKNSQSMANVKN